VGNGQRKEGKKERNGRVMGRDVGKLALRVWGIDIPDHLWLHSNLKFYSIMYILAFALTREL